MRVGGEGCHNISSTHIFVVGTDSLSFNWVDVLEWSSREAYHKVKVGCGACQQIEVVTHWHCRTAIHTLVQGALQVGNLGHNKQW